MERGVCSLGVWQLLGGSVVGVPGLGGEAGMVGQLMKKPGRLSRESFQDPSNPSLSGQHPPSVTSESSQRLLVVANRLPVSVQLLPRCARSRVFRAACARGSLERFRHIISALVCRVQACRHAGRLECRLLRGSSATMACRVHEPVW
jgi:hypothetical protein